MFGLGPGEIILILLIAIIFVGPRDLPRLGSQLGKLYRNFTKAAEELKNTVDRETRIDDPPSPKRSSDE